MNNTTKHTPGPWRVSRQARYITIKGSTGRTVARVLFSSTWQGDKGTATEDSDSRLISAAPALLEALQALMERASALDQSATEEGLRNCSAVANARQAIAQATGENQ